MPKKALHPIEVSEKIFEDVKREKAKVYEKYFAITLEQIRIRDTIAKVAMRSRQASTQVEDDIENEGPFSNPIGAISFTVLIAIFTIWPLYTLLINR